MKKDLVKLRQAVRTLWQLSIGVADKTLLGFDFEAEG